MTQRERDILKASVSWTDKTLTVNEEKAFQAGAKWADKTMIEKACQWLMKYFVLDHEGMSPSGYGVFEYMFRKAMEE